MSKDAAPKPMTHRAAFDSHADDYEAQLMNGLKVSGEPKKFFAQGRIDFLRRWWDRRGRPEPLRIIDYGVRHRRRDGAAREGLPRRAGGRFRSLAALRGASLCPLCLGPGTLRIAPRVRGSRTQARGPGSPQRRRPSRPSCGPPASFPGGGRQRGARRGGRTIREQSPQSRHSHSDGSHRV